MASKSKTKGKNWERDVCNFLSDLYRQSFIRVPNSGAYVGGKNEYRRDYLTEEQIKLSRGDIVPPLNYPYFLAECKNYAEFPFHSLLSKNSIPLLESWISQVEHDVTNEKDVWLLFIKITRKGKYLVGGYCRLDEMTVSSKYMYLEIVHYDHSATSDIRVAAVTNTPSANDEPGATTETMLDLDVDDHVSLRVYHNDSSSTVPTLSGDGTWERAFLWVQEIK